jgi:hypothetical protein
MRDLTTEKIVTIARFEHQHTLMMSKLALAIANPLDAAQIDKEATAILDALESLPGPMQYSSWIMALSLFLGETLLNLVDTLKNPDAVVPSSEALAKARAFILSLERR